nr:hypothetical protein [Actinomycetota bacterium]
LYRPMKSFLRKASSPRVAGIAICAVLMLAAIGVWLGGADSEDDRGGGPAAQASAGPFTDLVSEGLAADGDGRYATLPSLGAGLGSPERVPRGVQDELEENVAELGALRLDFENAELVQAPGTKSVWIVEGRGVTCIVYGRRAPALSCDTRVDAGLNGITVGTYESSSDSPDRPTSFTAAGIVPRGVYAVTVQIGREARTLPVRGRSWATRAPEAIRVRQLLRER